MAEVEPPLPDIKPEDLPLNVTSIPWKYLTPFEIEVTENSPEKLIQSLSSGKLSCTEVTEAFLRRAGIAQKSVILLLTILHVLINLPTSRQIASPSSSPPAPSPVPDP